MAVMLFGDRDVWSDSLVLPVDKDPQTEITLVDLVVRSDPLLEDGKSLLLEDTEGRKIGGGKVLVVKGCEVEASVSAETVVRDDLGSEIQMLLVLLPTTGLELLPLLFQTSL